MKRYLLFIATFTLLLCLLTACTAPVVEELAIAPETLPEQPPVTQGTALVELPEQPEQPLDDPPPLPKLELKLTEEPERYKPTPTIVPLTNSSRIYSNTLYGDITFIYIADQRRVELPPGVVYYAPVCEDVDGAVIAYALYNENGCIAFMSVNGKMLTNFIYSYIPGHNNDLYPNCYSYVTVMRDGACGLLDLRNGKEVIPPEYDCVDDDDFFKSLSPYNHAVVATKGGYWQLLDYSGKLLFEFDEEPNIGYYWPENDSEYYSFRGSGYTYLPHTGEIYSHALEESQYLCLYSGMAIVVTSYGYVTNSKTAIYDADGKVLFDGSNTWNYDCSGGAVIVPYKDPSPVVNIVTPEAVFSISIPEKNYGQSSSFSFDGNMVTCTYTYADANDSNLLHTVTYDLQGTKISNISEYEYPYYDANNHIRYRSQPEHSEQLEDEQGNILIPFGVYSHFEIYEPFLIGTGINTKWGSPDFDILNMQGKLLLHNPLSAITWDSALTDRMVVWLDEQNCVFLYPDGNMEPITNPPKVEREWRGG